MEHQNITALITSSVRISVEREASDVTTDDEVIASAIAEEAGVTSECLAADRKLTEDVIKANITSCPLCDKMAHLKFSDHVGYQNSFSYDIYHCNHCSTAFADPLKVESSIYNIIYSKVEKVPGYRRYLDYAKEVLNQAHPLNFLADTEDCYWGIRAFLDEQANKNAKILEVGCGLGYLTYALSKAGYQIQGMDISQVAVDNAIERYGPLFFQADLIEYAKKEEGSYDIIIFTELIEHIQDVKGFLKAANALLRPGGHLVMTTPNKTPYPADVLWETEPPPVHLWWFSEDSMRFLAKELNHSVDFINFLNFNRTELQKYGGYAQPYTAIRNFERSREPRLDIEGNVLSLPDQIRVPSTLLPAQPTPAPKQSILRKTIKTVLSKLGILSRLQDLKFYRGILKPYLALDKDPHKKRRITLCAVFTKPTS